MVWNSKINNNEIIPIRFSWKFVCCAQNFLKNKSNDILFYNRVLCKITTCEKKNIMNITEIIQEGQIGVGPTIQKNQ